jgi:hypothetical protein
VPYSQQKAYVHYRILQVRRPRGPAQANACAASAARGGLTQRRAAAQTAATENGRQLLSCSCLELFGRLLRPHLVVHAEGDSRGINRA